MPKDASDKNVLLVSRICVFVIALLGLLLALNPNSSIFNLVAFAWSGFGGTFGPLIILALYWKKTTAPGAVAGLLTGGATVVIWHNLHGGLFDVYEILPAFIVCLVVTIIVSLATKPDEEVLKTFDEYKNLAD
jgi:sodium/proline symporter